MRTVSIARREEPSAESQLRQAVAADLRLLAALHDREPTAALLDELRRAPFASRLGLVLDSEGARQALAAFDGALAALPATIDGSVVDDLAAGYADIYLTHHLRASPLESVWLDEDHLVRQEPMFEVRKWYRHYGLGTADWRNRPDDHLVLELQFIAELVSLEAAPAALGDAARFLDEHPLKWIGLFAERVATKGGHDYFAALALLTSGYLHELRARLTTITGIGVPLVAEAKDSDRRRTSPDPSKPQTAGC